MQKIDRKINYDTWVATDGLGRTTPLNDVVGNKDEEKKVGMFYFLWHDIDDGPIYDHTKVYEEEGLDGIWKVMKEGALGYPHYWAQPYFGYYRSDDEWVIRKHANMLVTAGVDFIFFDASNGLVYPLMYTKVLDTFMKMREEGSQTPQFIFFNGSRPDLGKIDTNYLWEHLYSKGLYKELWLMWEGKPLMLGDFTEVADDITAFFTIRASWAFNGWTGDGCGKWPWIAEYPQIPGKSETGEIEQLVVSSGFHATLSIGRSFHDGKQPTTGKPFDFELETTPYGLCLAEQWTTVAKIKPPVVMITGWNEWWAGRWENSDAGMLLASTYIIEKDHPQYKHFYVDNFNKEYSRELEPMKDGFGDCYYYQTVGLIRSYKGAQTLPKSSGKMSINIDAGIGEWNKVQPEYLDTLYDTAHRSARSFGGSLLYENATGRNDLDMAKVCQDDEYAYFLITTREKLVIADGENWMNLFIDVNPGKREGWEGYKYLINRGHNGDKVTVEVSEGGWNWKQIGTADLRIYENYLVIRVLKSTIGLNTNESFDFKWADNSTTTGDIMEFMDKGDAAPDGRFNFRYIG